MELKNELKAGDKIEIEIMPLSGQYKATTVDGTPFVEKFSVEAGELVVENWKKDGSKDILCDVDHSSVDTKDTSAAGWVSELRVDKDALRLKGMLTVSEKGSRLLNGVEYRYLSPVLLFTEDNRPYYLDSVSLTNTPRLEELKPVYNSKNFTDEKEEVANEEQKTEEEKPEEKPEEKTEEISVNNDGESIKSMNELITILGLPPEAVEEDIINAVKALVEKVKSITEAEIAEEAEEIVNECGIDADKKEEVVNCYKQNPALVKSVLNAIKKVPGKMVVNAQEAVKPELTEDEKLKREYNALKGGKERVDFLKKHPSIKL